MLKTIKWTVIHAHVLHPTHNIMHIPNDHFWQFPIKQMVYILHPAIKVTTVIDNVDIKVMTFYKLCNASTK